MITPPKKSSGLQLSKNYDDTLIKQQIEGKVDKVEGMGLSHNDLTDELVEKINASTKSMQLKTRVDTEADLPPDPAVGDTYFVGLEGASEFEQYTYTEGGWLNTGTTSADLAKYLLKDEATALLAGKVDKVEGKGLSTNDYTTAEKEKLDRLTNYDDTAIREQIGRKVDAVAGKGLSTNDYTTDEKEKLSNLSNYDDTSIRAQLAGKVDTIEGKGLSTNDYTDEEKAKVAATSKIDDTTTSETSTWSSKQITGGVANVPVTPITSVDDTTNFGLGSANHFYVVRNGVCYFQIYLLVRNPVGSMTVVREGFPKPLGNQLQYWAFPPYNGAADLTPLRFAIEANGQVKAAFGTTNGQYMCHGSYPVQA